MTMSVALERYAAMIRMRAFEEVVGVASASGEIHGEMHLDIGAEALAAVLGEYLRHGDALVGTHRAHLYALVAGVDPGLLLAELLERDGLNHGKGGHMHLFDPTTNFMCTGIVGAGAPIAAGYALKQALHDSDAVTVAIVGDGAMNQGAVMETLNLAAVRGLPMIFLCEDNAYAISVHRDISTAGQLAERGLAFGIPGYTCDGTDPDAIDQALGEAFTRARVEREPSLVVATVHRFRGHYEGDLDQYRTADEKEQAERERDPLSRMRTALEASGVGGAVLAEVDRGARSVVAGWLESARSRPFPPVATAERGVYAP